MRIYKSGEQIGVQDSNGKNYFFTKEMNKNPPKDFKLSMEAPKRRRKAVSNGNTDAG